ncbi:MarR family winged helix-turn-helix transcriptional regulator [Clostridium sp. Cult3]|uniref:MarR family winged helix-turn-helix transcriptional regulator n=1 Tax=Clostridium sp. Cult3 TaxID=2079004 RepID=UPI001F437DFA|nr:MarR family transcriptional regulator [Clostridium sp. Cult3]MCF6460674.1 MarR family transcriptional regulator [Clostridium sp. Cult3]
MGNSIEDIIYDLIKFMSLFHRLFTPAFKKGADDRYNCTKNQARAIMIIGRANKITPTILGKCMGMEKGSITTLIDSMENMNLVYRVDDPTDKRKVWIQLSEEGKQYYLKQEERFLKKIEEVFQNLTKEEIGEFSHSLKNIVEILEKVRDD